MTTASLVFALGAACGGDGGNSGVASLSGSRPASDDAAGGGSSLSGISAEFEDAMVEFARCMRERGIDFPDPSSGGGLIIGPDSDVDPEDADFKEAEAKCKPILDEAEKSMPKPSEAELAKMRDSMLAFARCMRGEGIDMPDPEFGEGGRVEAPLADPDDPDFRKAQEKCADKTGGIGITRRAPGRGKR